MTNTLKHSKHGVSAKKPFLPVFRFLASLQLAILLLGAMIVIFSAGTIIESLHGTSAAKVLVYDTWWLEFVFFLLAVNLTASAFSRWPWQVKHVGFVVTHLGIILILAGSFVTKRWMLDAQMPIEEGKSEYRVIVDEPVIYLFEQGTSWQFPIRKKAFAWEGRETLTAEGGNAPWQVTLLNYYPKGRLHEVIEKAPEGPAALRLLLENSFIRQEQWLIQDDSQLGRVQLGPVEIRLTDEPLVHENADREEQAYLEFRWPDRVLQVPVSQDMTLPHEASLEQDGWKARVDAVYQRAMIEGSVLKEQESGPLNPAVVLRLEGPEGLSEKHTVFANFPDFPTQHGMKPSASGARIFYRLPGGQGSKSKSHELRFVVGKDGLRYQQLSGQDFKEDAVEPGRKVATGWMGLEFSVEEFYPHAAQKRFFTPEPNTSESQRAFPAVRIELSRDGHTQPLWLAQDTPEPVSFQGHTLRAAYGKKRVPLPFKLTLKDFRVEEYPGTSRAASFESDVTLRDDFRGEMRDVRIAMNEPLIYQGLRVFQASYVRTPGEPDISVFSVAHDPGIFLKYSGAAVMVAGIVTMFYTRRFSTVKNIGEDKKDKE